MCSSDLQDFPLEWTVPCTVTTSTIDGASCDLGTELDALVPGATPERTRAIWQLDQVQVYDGGADQNGDTENVADTNSAKLCQMRSIYPPFPTGVVVTQRRMMLRMLVPSMIHAAVSAEKITPQPPKPAR